MAVRVWSEREPKPAGQGWTDCVWSSGLTVLDAAGFPAVQGVDRNAERQALERSQDDWLPESGGNFIALDEAIRARYGIALRPTMDLASLLGVPDLAIAVDIPFARLPAPLRRWSPAFTGRHAAVAVTRAAGPHVWLDPLAWDLYGGDHISAAELLAVWDGRSVRYLALDELAEDLVNVIAPVAAYRTGRASFGPNQSFGVFVVGANPDPASFVRDVIPTGDGGSSAPVDGPWGWTGHMVEPGWWRLTAGPWSGMFLSRNGPQADVIAVDLGEIRDDVIGILRGAHDAIGVAINELIG